MPMEIVGPFTEYRVLLDGSFVPRLAAIKNENGNIDFELDRRYLLPNVPEELATGVASMIANAMAIGAGYSCFGEHSNLLNEYKCHPAPKSSTD